MHLAHVEYYRNNRRHQRTCVVLLLKHASEVIFFCPVPLPQLNLASFISNTSNVYIISPFPTSSVHAYASLFKELGIHTCVIFTVEDAKRLPEDITLSTSGAWTQPDLWLYCKSLNFLAVSHGIVGTKQSKSGFTILDTVFERAEGAKKCGYLPFSYSQYLVDRPGLVQTLRMYLPKGVTRLCSHVGGMCLDDDGGVSTMSIASMSCVNIFLSWWLAVIVQRKVEAKRLHEALLKMIKLQHELHMVKDRMSKCTRNPQRRGSAPPSIQGSITAMHMDSTIDDLQKTKYFKGMNIMVYRDEHEKWFLGEVVALEPPFTMEENGKWFIGDILAIEDDQLHVDVREEKHPIHISRHDIKLIYDTLLSEDIGVKSHDRSDDEELSMTIQDHYWQDYSTDDELSSLD